MIMKFMSNYKLYNKDTNPWSQNSWSWNMSAINAICDKKHDFLAAEIVGFAAEIHGPAAVFAGQHFGASKQC